MSIVEVIGIITTLSGIAFGFGAQSNRINVLRKNVDDIAKMHRETIAHLHDVNIQLAEIRRDIVHLKEK